MSFQLFVILLLNGLSYGLLLFLLSAGLTLIFSLMGVLNFAHASFYMLGAYVAYALSAVLGFVPALLLAPLLVGALGAGFEYLVLRRVQRQGQVAQLLVTFGLSYVVLELVQLLWGRSTVVNPLPAWLQGPLFSLYGAQFPRSRAFIMGLALALLCLLWLVFARTRLGWLVQAALTHAPMVQALGHNMPRLLTLVFAGGCALAALAGAVGGTVYVTEPAMAAAVGPLIFVVIVVGGVGSLFGAFAAALLLGLLQTLAVALDVTLAQLLAHGGLALPAQDWAQPLLQLSLAQTAPLLPYVLLVLLLVLRPRGLWGRWNVD